MKNYQNKKMKNILIKSKIIKNSDDKFSKTMTNFNRRKILYQDKNPIKVKKDKIKKDLNYNKNIDLEKELNKSLDPKEYDFIIPNKYSPENYSLIKTEKYEDKKLCLYTNNKREIIFPSGIKKEIYDDGFQLIYFTNGDIKQSYIDGKIIYLYKETDTIQTTYPNGIQIFKFSNGQIEKHFPNGLKKIFFPNGTIDYLFTENKKE